MVYILGFEKVSGIELATLWITDLEGNHISTIHLSSNSSLAEFFIKQGTLLYISGYETHNGIKTAMLWMRDSYGQYIKTVTLGNEINQSTTYGIVSLKNKIYVAGKETQSTNKTALLWILSAQGERIGTSSLFTSQDFIIAELLPFSQKIYLNADIGFGYPINASIFIIDPNGNIVKTTSLSNEDNTFILAGSKSLRNQLYVLGFEKQNNQAISSLSIINSNGDLIKKEFLGEFNENYTFTFAVTSINNRIYVAGTKTNGSINNASLWILDYQGNILNTSLLDNSSNASSASFILSFDSLRSIFQAIKSFSPVKEQKGL